MHGHDATLESTQGAECRHARTSATTSTGCITKTTMGEGHRPRPPHIYQGKNEEKKKLRAEIRFPNKDAEVKARMRHCQACAAKEEEQKPTLSDTKVQIPISWSQLSLDICKFPNGQVMAILIDSYSKFPVVVTLQSTAFRDIRTALGKDFVLLYAPEERYFDNRRPLHGGAFRDYLASIGIMHNQRTVVENNGKGEREYRERAI